MKTAFVVTMVNLVSTVSLAANLYCQSPVLKVSAGVASQGRIENVVVRSQDGTVIAHYPGLLWPNHPTPTNDYPTYSLLKNQTGIPQLTLPANLENYVPGMKFRGLFRVATPGRMVEPLFLECVITE